MDIARHVEELQRQLLTAAAAGDEQTQEVARRLTAAIEAATRLAMLEALSAAAGEITLELAPGSVDVRLRGRDVGFVVTRPAADTTATPQAQPAAPVEDEEGATSRTTLRLPDALKARAEAAAAESGVSLNTWFVRAVGAALEPQRSTPQSHGNHYQGWVR